ncbi:hypothetical protein [Lentilactobacillus sunkii]|uniref:D-alanyl-D-alanine carboxypeptidase n=1 Tax=Lentilactobacillus sunkii DSM 19904 TaxID=1423808 RepID=A0A0R1L3U6_9LACO|nr:hypothetical protein [Lentilactobacillus sunkii]KRK87018.1 hypothetical protein FD17_GL001479 [Lentilactobacillus sunkii DSM 19904]
MKVKHLLFAALALGAFVIAKPTTAHAAVHYKILKTYALEPQQYHVKGNILSQKFKTTVHNKYRQKNTWFGTWEKALVRTPSGKKAIYYAVGTSIPQIDGANSGLPDEKKELEGWTWHKNLYHKRSLAQPKADIQFLYQLTNSVPKNERSHIISDLSKVKPGEAYQNYQWRAPWKTVNAKNMRKLMNEINNEKDLADVVQDFDSTPSDIDDNLTTKEGNDADPMFRLKVITEIYDYFRPRFKAELTAKGFKVPDNYAKHLKEMSTWSQEQYNAYIDKHITGNMYFPQDFGDSYLYQLINGLGRSNTSFRESTLNNF